MLTILFAKFWPALIGLAGIAGSFLFAWVNKKAADAKVARAAQQAAQAQADMTATREVLAQGNAAAAQAGEQAAANAAAAQAQASQLSADQLDAEGAALGILRKD